MMAALFFHVRPGVATRRVVVRGEGQGSLETGRACT